MWLVEPSVGKCRRKKNQKYPNKLFDHILSVEEQKCGLVELSFGICAIGLSPECKSKTEPCLIQYPRERECHYEDSQLESVHLQSSPSGSRLWAFS